MSVKGNKNGTKLKDAEIRQEAYRQFCDHLAEGYPKEAFFFDHPTHSVCWRTMDRYIEENPTEFQAILKEKAMAARYKHWFSEGKSLMKGGYQYGSPLVWQIIMRNMFKDVGWDQESVVKQPGASQASVITVAKLKEMNVRNPDERKADPELSESNS